MSDIDKPRHDKLFRKSFENPLVAREFVESYLPTSIVNLIDIDSLKLEKDTFTDETLTAAACDVLFSVKFKKNNQKLDGFIWILLEHQSKPEHFMAFRLFKYMLSRVPLCKGTQNGLKIQNYDVEYKLV